MALASKALSELVTKTKQQRQVDTGATNPITEIATSQ